VKLPITCSYIHLTLGSPYVLLMFVMGHWRHHNLELSNAIKLAAVDDSVCFINFKYFSSRESLKNITCVSMFKSLHRPIRLYFSQRLRGFGAGFLPLVYQAYWYACGKSFFFAVLTEKRISPMFADLKDILSAASKSTLDIDVTRYLNVDALIRTKGIHSLIYSCLMAK
jgi:hypothetical protein